jgi:hypothetical protein
LLPILEEMCFVVGIVRVGLDIEKVQMEQRDIENCTLVEDTVVVEDIDLGSFEMEGIGLDIVDIADLDTVGNWEEEVVVEDTVEMEGTVEVVDTAVVDVHYLES